MNNANMNKTANIMSGEGAGGVIEVRNVSKYYKEVCALQSVNAKLERGKIYGLLGRNGAGKSTLLNIITNKIFATSGSVYIDGVPAMENDGALSNVYAMTEVNYYPPDMKIKEIFKWTKEFYPQFDAQYSAVLSEQFKLNTNKKVRALSTGYSSVYKIIIALCVNTPFVLLDEPVLGLDANHRDLFYKSLLERYTNSPHTYVISTHLIEEVAHVVENVIMIKDGQLIVDEPCESLLGRSYAVTGKQSAVDEYTRAVEGRVLGCDGMGALKTAYVLGQPPQHVPAELEVSKPDLQRLFIQLTN